MNSMRLFQASNVAALTSLTRSQVREWTSRDRRNLVPADVEPEGPGRHALYTWQTVLVLRLLRSLQLDFAIEVAAWAPGMNVLRRRLDRVSFPSLWGSVVHFPSRSNPQLISVRDAMSPSGVILPLDPHLMIIATSLSLHPPSQLYLFPVMAVAK